MINAYLIPIETIESELKTIQDFLEKEYPVDLPNAVVERAVLIEYYMSHSGKLFADAKYYRDKFLNSAIIDTVKEALQLGAFNASVINKKIDAIAMDYNYLVNWAERTNRACTHQLDFARSIISKHKTEYRP